MSKVEANSCILDIKPYKPGKSKVSNNQKIIKLSSNENALGSSPKAVKAYQDEAGNLNRYPDGSSTDLRRAIAKKYDIDSDRIVCGAGSDEIIALLVQAFVQEGDEVLYSEYGFLMYPISAKRVGANPIVAKEVGRKVNINNLLAKISSKTKIIFIANPNNPTGSYLTSKEIESLIVKTPKNVIIVLDLAYGEFVDLLDYPDVVELVNEHDNVVMTRTFSKIYGLASLRLGWSYSSSYIADILNRVRGPFNVNGPTQVAGIAAIKDDGFIRESKSYNDKWLKIVSDELKKIGLKIYPSIANFVLIDFMDKNRCRGANQYLLDNGVILREMGAYNLPTCLRMTIGTEEENKKVVKLFECFAQGNSNQ